MQKDDLFELIHSMNKIEKSHFKKYAQRHIQKDTVNYFLLFDEISKMSVYDEIKLKKRINNKNLIKNLPRLKNYLYELILKSLRSISAPQSPEYQIKENLFRAEMLMDRALSEQSKKFIQKARIIAQSYDIPLGHIEINQAEKKLEYNFTRNQHTKTNINKLHDHTIAQINELSIQEEFKNILLYLSISHSYNSGDTKHEAYINAVKTNKLLAEDSYSKLSIKNKIYSHLIRHFFSENEKNTATLISDLEIIIQLIESDTHLRKVFAAEYCNSLLNLSSILMRDERYDEGFKRLEQLRQEYIEQNFLPTHSSSRKVISFYYAVLLLSTIQSGRMELAHSEFEKAQQHYEFEINHNGDQLLLAYLSVSLAYHLFVHEKYRQCNKIINNLLNDKSNINHLAHYDMLVLNFMNHYHLGNYDYLKSTIKQIIRIIKNTEKMGYFNEVLHYVNHTKNEIVTQTDANELLAEIKNLLLTKSTPDTFHQTRIINKRILLDWITCAIEGNSFYQVLKNRRNT
ncbi:MAG: hypothetical protein IM638_17910 [Bacteroidetes bacterium]|nr:hypothetical protein [Bacteroidota bacterium]